MDQKKERQLRAEYEQQLEEHFHRFCWERDHPIEPHYDRLGTMTCLCGYRKTILTHD